MDTTPHAFADSREATTYTVLQRVLQNHRTTHALSLLAALTAAVLLLVGTCMPRCEAGGVEEGTLLRQTLAGLKQPTLIRTIPGCVPRRRRSVGRSPRCWVRPRRPTISRRRAVGGSRPRSWPICCACGCLRGLCQRWSWMP